MKMKELSWHWETTSILHRRSAATDHAWLGWRGTIPTCPGMVANCGRHVLMNKACCPTRKKLRAAPRSRFSNLNGHRMVCFTSFPIEADGGTFTGSLLTATSNRFTRWKLSLACRSGASACPATVLSLPKESSAHMLTVEYFVWRSSTLEQKTLNPLKRHTPISGMCGLRTAWPLCGLVRQLNLLRLSGSIVLPAPLISCDVPTISISTRDTFPFHRPLNFLPPETPRPTASFIVLRIVTITLPKRNARLC